MVIEHHLVLCKNKTRWGHGSLQRPLAACSTFISFSETDYTFIIRWISVLSYKIFPRIPCICGAQWDINRSCLFSLFPFSSTLPGTQIWWVDFQMPFYKWKDKAHTPGMAESESVSQSVMSDSLCLWGCSPPGSSVYGILQARILEWVAIPFSRGSSWPRDQIWVS